MGAAVNSTIQINFNIISTIFLQQKTDKYQLSNFDITFSHTELGVSGRKRYAKSMSQALSTWRIHRKTHLRPPPPAKRGARRAPNIGRKKNARFWEIFGHRRKHSAPPSVIARCGRDKPVRDCVQRGGENCGSSHPGEMSQDQAVLIVLTSTLPENALTGLKR